MNRNTNLCHTKWECKYHIVFVPKYRRKELYGKIKNYLGILFHELAKQRESRIEEGHICSDHVHMCISIPPKFSISQVVGYIKGKSAIYIAREFQGKKRNFYGQSFWARGYYVSTVGRDEETIREYIRSQSAHEAKISQLKIQVWPPLGGKSRFERLTSSPRLCRGYLTLFCRQFVRSLINIRSTGCFSTAC